MSLSEADEPKGFTPKRRDSLHDVEDLDDKAVSNLKSIRDILHSPKVTGTDRATSEEVQIEPIVGIQKTIVHYVKRTPRINSFIRMWEIHETPDERKRLEDLSIDTVYGDLKACGTWEDEPVVALDFLTSVVKRFQTYIYPKLATSATDIEITDDASALVTIRDEGVIDMNWLLEESHIVAKIEKDIHHGGVLSEAEIQKRKMEESRYHKLLGKSLNTRMRGQNLKDRYINAEIKASLAIGTGHLTGLITMALLGYYLATYMFEKDHYGRYMGGLIAIVLFLIMEATLFMFRESRIQKTIRDAEKQKEARNRKFFKPTTTIHDGVKPDAVVEKEKAIAAAHAESIVSSTKDKSKAD